MTYLEKIETAKLLLDAISCELKEPTTKTLEDAKAIVDDYRLLFNLCEKLEKGEANAFIEEIRKLCETDPKEALKFALGDARAKLGKVGLD